MIARSSRPSQETVLRDSENPDVFGAGTLPTTVMNGNGIALKLAIVAYVCTACVSGSSPGDVSRRDGVQDTEGWQETVRVTPVGYVDDHDLAVIVRAVNRTFEVAGGSKDMKLNLFSNQRYPYGYFTYAKPGSKKGPWPNYANTVDYGDRSIFGVVGCYQGQKNECHSLYKGARDDLGHHCLLGGKNHKACEHARKATDFPQQLQTTVMVASNLTNEYTSGIGDSEFPGIRCIINSHGATDRTTSHLPFRAMSGKGEWFHYSVCRPPEPLFKYSRKDEFTFIDAGCLPGFEKKCERRAVYLRSTDRSSDDPSIERVAESAKYPLVQPHELFKAGYHFLGSPSKTGSPLVTLTSEAVPNGIIPLSITFQNITEETECPSIAGTLFAYPEDGSKAAVTYSSIQTATFTVFQVDGPKPQALVSALTESDLKHTADSGRASDTGFDRGIGHSNSAKGQNNSVRETEESEEKLPLHYEQNATSESVELHNHRTTIRGTIQARGVNLGIENNPHTSWISGCQLRSPPDASVVPVSPLLLSELPVNCTGSTAITAFRLNHVSGKEGVYFYGFKCKDVENLDPFSRSLQQQANHTITVERDYQKLLEKNQPHFWYFRYPNQDVDERLDFGNPNFGLLKLGTVSCEDHLMTGFALSVEDRIVKDNGNIIQDKAWYSWTCSGTKVRKETCKEHTTRDALVTDMQTFASQVDSVECTNSYIVEFELISNKTGHYQYRYKCCNAFEDLLQDYTATLDGLNKTQLLQYNLLADPTSLSAQWEEVSRNASRIQRLMSGAAFPFPEARQLVTEISFEQSLFKVWLPFLEAEMKRDLNDTLFLVPQYNVLKYVSGNELSAFLNGVGQTLDMLSSKWVDAAEKEFEFSALLSVLDSLGKLLTESLVEQARSMRNQVDLEIAALEAQAAAICERLKAAQDIANGRVKGIEAREKRLNQAIHEYEEQQRRKAIVSIVTAFAGGWKGALKFFAAQWEKGSASIFEQGLEELESVWKFGFSLGMSESSVDQGSQSTARLVSATRTVRSLYAQYDELQGLLPESLQVATCENINRNVPQTGTGHSIVDPMRFLVNFARSLGSFSRLVVQDMEVSTRQFFLKFTSGSISDTSVSTAALDLQEEIVAAMEAVYDTKESLLSFTANTAQMIAADNLKKYIDALQGVLDDFHNRKDSLEKNIDAGERFMRTNLWHTSIGSLIGLSSHLRQLTLQLCVPFVYAYPDTITGSSRKLPQLCQAVFLHRHMQEALVLLKNRPKQNSTFAQDYSAMQGTIDRFSALVREFSTSIEEFRQKTLQREANPGNLKVESVDFLVVDTSGFNSSRCQGTPEEVNNYTTCAVGTSKNMDPPPTLPPYPKPLLGMNCTAINALCNSAGPEALAFRNLLDINASDPCYCVCEVFPSEEVCTQREVKDFVQVRCQELSVSLNPMGIPCVGADFSAFRESNGSKPVSFNMASFPATANLPGLGTFFFQGFEAFVHGGGQLVRAPVVVNVRMPPILHQWAPVELEEPFTLQAKKGYLTFDARTMADFVQSWTYLYKEDIPESYPGQFGNGCACQANEVPRCMCYWSVQGSCPIDGTAQDSLQSQLEVEAKLSHAIESNPCKHNRIGMKYISFRDCSGYHVCSGSELRGNFTCPQNENGIQLLMHPEGSIARCKMPCESSSGGTCVSCKDEEYTSLHTEGASTQCPFCACDASISGPDASKVFQTVLAPPTPLAQFGLTVRNLDVTGNDVSSILMRFLYTAESSRPSGSSPDSPANNPNNNTDGHSTNGEATLRPLPGSVCYIWWIVLHTLSLLLFGWEC